MVIAGINPAIGAAMIMAAIALGGGLSAWIRWLIDPKARKVTAPVVNLIFVPIERSAPAATTALTAAALVDAVRKTLEGQ